MKCFLLLLACLAAANAHTYYQSSSYTYMYYCQHHFNVLPPSACYHYTIYFPSTWCSYKYYSNIVKSYPSNSDYCYNHYHCWSERSVSSLTREVRNLLATERSKMCSQMYAKRDAYFRTIDAIHRQFNYWYKTYLYQWYTYRYSHCGYTGYITIRNTRISTYCQKLADMRADLWNKYNAAISAKINALNEFHGKIVSSFETCLNTRLSKIAEFRRALDKQISTYYSKFYSVHCSLAYKNYQHYRQVLSDLFYRYSGSWWVNWKASISASYYYSRQKSKVYSISYSYRSHLYSYKNKLIPFYTCHYKCTLGYTNFDKRAYYAHCQSLGRWWYYKSSYCLDRYCLAPFKIKFTPCSYKTLKTCDVNAVVGDISGLISQLESQRDQIIRDNDSKYKSWRNTWLGYFLRYKAEYIRIVNDRHAFLCAWTRRTYYYTCGYLSSVQIAYLAQMKRDLIIRASQACSAYYSSLFTQLYRADRAHSETQKKFKDTFNSLISQLQAKFDACKNTRTTKIAEYKKKLEQSRNEQRSKLLSKFNSLKSAHYSKFHEMLRHYHGSCYWKYTYIRYMYSCYASHICGVISDVMREFDAFWRSMLPKLVMHYACSYKCSVSAKIVPRYSCGYWYSWKYCLPTYSTYTYQYSCWYKHHTCISY